MITTNNINGRSDWFVATGRIGKKVYTKFADTRHGAFMQVLMTMFMDSLVNGV